MYEYCTLYPTAFSRDTADRLLVRNAIYENRSYNIRQELDPALVSFDLHIPVGCELQQRSELLVGTSVMDYLLQDVDENILGIQLQGWEDLFADQLSDIDSNTATLDPANAKQLEAISLEQFDAELEAMGFGQVGR